MSRKRRLQIEEPTINITPLIDVVFVVLIMFIIIAPILEKDRIELSQNTQTSSISKIEHTSPISIHINSKNQIFLNRMPVALSCLSNQLILIKNQHPQAVPQVYYDKKAYFEWFEPLKGALEKAGFHDMDLILEPSN